MGHVILLDEGRIRHIGTHIARALGGSGHEVLVATAGEARRRIEACRAHGVASCVVLDAAADLGAIGPMDGAHVVALAAGREEHERVAVIADEVLERPCSVSRAAAVVEEALHRRARPRFAVA